MCDSSDFCDIEDGQSFFAFISIPVSGVQGFLVQGPDKVMAWHSEVCDFEISEAQWKDYPAEAGFYFCEVVPRCYYDDSDIPNVEFSVKKFHEVPMEDLQDKMKDILGV